MLRLAHGLIASAALAQRRNIAVFTEQSEVLANNAKHRGFKSNVWVEVEDAWWTKRIAALKAGEAPTKAPIQRRIELYNVDQLVKRPDDLESRAMHSSMRTMAPYSQAFQEELEGKAKVHGFGSKWWLSEREVVKRNLSLRHDARPSVIMMRAIANLVNADQFDKPAELSRIALSAATKKPYSSAMQATLAADIAKNNYPTGLYFSTKQLEAFDMTDLIKPETQPVIHELTRPSLSLYNIDDIVKGDALLKELQRFPVEVDSYVFSGKPVGGKMQEKVAAAGKTGKYWVSSRDVESHKLKVVRGSKPIAFSEKAPIPVKMYSVHQLTNPAEGFKKAGTRAL
jgi:hypothetical protein